MNEEITSTAVEAAEIALTNVQKSNSSTKILFGALAGVGALVVGRTLYRGMKAKKAQQTAAVEPTSQVIETSAKES